MPSVKISISEISMKNPPKTIQIFLPSGNPRGIRVAEITTRIVQVIDVPRSLLSEFFKMPESKQVALYFLMGGADEPLVYVGQTGDLANRLNSHNKNKDFWERALVVISRTNSLTQTHALFLEWYCIQAIREAVRYDDENGNSGSRPHTPAPLEADCLEIFDTTSTLVSTLSHPLFLPLIQKPASEEESKDELFYCQGSEADGKGVYTSEGFVVLKGSSGRNLNTESAKKLKLDKPRKKLLDSEITKQEGDRMIFLKDHLFSSPSSAALAVMGRSANGWIEWRNNEGKTLDEIKRQPIQSAEEK